MEGETGYFVQPYWTPRHLQPTRVNGLVDVVIPFEFLNQKSAWGCRKWMPHPDAHRVDAARQLWDTSVAAVAA